MSAVLEAVLTDSTFESRELSYAALERAKAARYCTLYDRLQIENPAWRSPQLCGELGISAQRLNKYRCLLGAPKRVTKMTTEQKQAAQAKGMLTRAKNAAYKQYLAELREKKLEFPEMKRQLEEWEREHGMPDMTQREGSAAIPSSGVSGVEGDTNAKRKIKRGGSAVREIEQPSQSERSAPLDDGSCSPDEFLRRYNNRQVEYINAQSSRP